MLSPGSSKPDLEIYPVAVNVEIVGVGEVETDARVVLYMSRVDKLRDLKRRALAKYGLEPDLPVSLWSAEMLKRQKVYKPVLLRDLGMSVSTPSVYRLD